MPFVLGIVRGVGDPQMEEMRWVAILILIFFTKCLG